MAKSIQITNPPGGSMVNHAFSASGIANEANGDTAEAIEALDRSLAAVDEQKEVIKKQGGKPPDDPPWVGEARSLREKLAAQHQSASAARP